MSSIPYSSVGRLLRVACRDEDLVARYVGEEFALVLVGLELKAAVRVCERVRSTIEEFGWESVAPGLKVTVSLGLTDELTFGSSQSMLATADRKLYQAKREGRNRVCA
jgi:two-component system cell cycle response regulator